MALILVVDDSATDQLGISRMIESGGYEVITAASGEEALDVAVRDKPDLILMDVMMPQMNGFQTTRKLSSHPDTADIPIIILTSRDQESDRIWGLRQGACDYVVKPPEKQELLSRIRKILGEGQ